jgi:hypothetical protein
MHAIDSFQDAAAAIAAEMEKARYCFERFDTGHWRRMRVEWTDMQTIAV